MKLTQLILGFLLAMMLAQSEMVLCSIESLEQILELEVPDETHSQVLVREHPRTGKPYTVIVEEGFQEPRYAFQKDRRNYLRPDYRMLDPKIKAKDIPYTGPSSDRKKVYLFAASLAASGVAAGTLLPVTAATGAGASTGAGIYGAAGTAVASGVTSAATTQTTPRPDDDFAQHSEATRVNSKSQNPNSKETPINNKQ